ncbi:MAG: insulinase family protein [Muribaculaceae bacterium]|nr:insulinase family protein [Muribaculaceae bacterium]
MNLRINSLALMMTAVVASASTPFETELDHYVTASMTPGKVVSQQDVPQFNSTIYTLSNGIKLYFHPTDANPGKVSVMAVSNGGFSQNYDPAKKGLYKSAEDLLNMFNFGPFTADSINSYLKGQGMKATVNIDKQIEELEASGPADKLETIMQLVYLKATDMRPDTAVINRYLDKKSRYVRNVANSPVLAMADSIHSIVYRRHPLGEKLHYQDFSVITPEAYSELYSERFGDMADFCFIISGDVDAETVLPLAEKYVASLPAAGRIEHSKEIGFGYPDKSEVLNYTYEMKKPVGITYSFRNGDCDYNLGNILNAQIFGLVLSTRLNRELRHNRGIINHIKTHCSVTYGFNGDKTPGHFILPTYIRCTPGKEAEVHAAVEQEINNIANAGVTDEELEKIKSSLAKAHQEHLRQNNYWNTVLRVYALYDRDMNTGFDEILDGINSRSISDFAKTYVLPANKTVLTMRLCRNSVLRRSL